MEIKVEANKLENFLSKYQSNIKKISQVVLNDIADYTFKKMKQNYSQAEYQAGETMDFVKIGTENEKTVSMVGPQAWYSEFGTGTQGELHPHIWKSEFALNPYNSGKTIRPAGEKVSAKTGIPVGELYWTYKANDGEIYYTQGIPAQMEVYWAGISAEKKLPTIIKQDMEDAALW